nr:helix-turn-helix domain-containing protein [Aurantimonas sp. VKM B-3413]
MLLPEFSLLGVVGALETLRVANSLGSDPVFQTRLVHDAAPLVRSSGGIALEASCHLRDLVDFDALIVCASFRADSYEREETQALLRRFARHGKAIGAIESGVYHIARAGLLDGHVATAHFNNLPYFAQLFPAVRFERRVCAIDRRRMTCAGGSAAVDMMLHLVKEHLGPLGASRVANLIIHPYRREAESFLDDVFTSAHSDLPLPVRKACRKMAEAVEAGCDIEVVATDLSMSRRHLDRLFRAAFSRTAAEHYRMMRLARARKLIKATRADLSTIAARCGFASYSHFLRRYKAAFGVSPTEDRRSNLPVPAAPGAMSPLDDLHPYQNQLDPVRMV